MIASLELENENPTDIKWQVLKNVYDKEVSRDIKRKMIGSAPSVLMMFIMSIVPALKIDNDDELLELQNRLSKYHNDQVTETLMFTKGGDDARQ